MTLTNDTILKAYHYFCHKFNFGILKFIFVGFSDFPKFLPRFWASSSVCLGFLVLVPLKSPLIIGKALVFMAALKAHLSKQGFHWNYGCFQLIFKVGDRFFNSISRELVSVSKDNVEILSKSSLFSLDLRKP